MKSNPKCPTNVKDVTPEWLQEVMTTALNDDVEVIHLNAVSDNAGLLSSTFKAQIKTTAANTTVNLFIKIGFELGKDNHLDEFVGKTNIDRLEVKAYREDLDHLINFEQQNHGTSKIADIIPKVYCCDINANPDDRGLYIIMEDLSNEYGPVEKSKGTSFQGLKVILESIATFHAVSYCYGKIKNVIFAANQPKHPTVGFLSLNDRVRKVDGFFEMVKEDFRGHETGQDMLPFFEKLSKHWQTAMTRVFEDETENRFLSHGDLWVNNVMLRKDEKACKIFDWQFLCPKGPYLDLVRAVAYGAHPSNIDKWCGGIT